MLHGFGLDSRMWAPQQSTLAGYRTIALDLPGFGRSPRAAEPLADLMAGTLDSLGVEGTHLVGLSLGGAAATELALAHPARVRSLVLADPLLLDHPGTLETWDRCVELARTGHCASAREHWKTDAVFTIARRQPLTWLALASMMDAYDCAHWTGAATLRWCCTKPQPRLAEIRVPTLVVVGEHDTPAFQGMAQAYAAGIPGARMLTLRGAGHCSNLEAPVPFTQILTDFLTAL